MIVAVYIFYIYFPEWMIETAQKHETIKGIVAGLDIISPKVCVLKLLLIK
jgi:hypothetical protein